MAKDDDEHEVARRLRAKVEREWGEAMAVDFEGPGPFELPLFGKQVSASIRKDKVFLLQLETATKEQRVFLPISTEALMPLKTLIDHMLNQYGLGQQKH